MRLRTVLFMGALLAPLVALLVRLHVLFRERAVDFSFHEREKQCVLHAHKNMQSSEDVVLWKNGIALTGSGDILKYLRAEEASPDGGVFAAYMGDVLRSGKGPESMVLEQVELEGYPSDIPLRIHGLHLSNATNRLYAVNHPGGFSRVEVFEISERPDGGPALRWLFAFAPTDGSFPVGGLNAVVEGTSPKEIYVTVFKPRGLKPPGLDEFFDSVEELGHILFASESESQVLRCVVDDDESEPQGTKGKGMCGKAASGFVLVNGMTADPGRNLFFVNEMIKKEVRVFSRSPEDGSLRYIKALTLPSVPDNIHFDSESGDLYVQTFPSFFRAALAMQKPVKEAVRVPGASLIFKNKGGAADGASMEYGERTIDHFLHDGSVLNFPTGFTRFGPLTLIGSVGATKGVMLCRDI
uniref:SMP-30/Gluconolactonase/LRE-like region domain-containing protein n=1 Tax=Chromera velia CCMP2878 TaxID=1169474 RepID=A0A0G4GPK6_9ALVE|eukprot:Cvel_22820.t1-p1 / transcript=Cvel_22820.t1 / gene=Cvel_22820 / organism=Chromera_velia_CCMP2878 / gene_product=hypothetical protein / transcript_product=hypothetical protein / location=Cvel_scaffold2285:21628-22857(-) / protein_length=410 / sequence_SO=supercontig / SO=protein_coding / is_pseudo=false